MEAALYSPNTHHKLSVKRRITPSPEKLSRTKAAYISPASETRRSPEKRPRRFARRDKDAVHDSTLPVTLSAPNNLPSTLNQARHIIFTDFSLIENGSLRLPRSSYERQLLFGLFDTTFSVDVGPLMITIRVKTLPSKPWPVSVGGAPLFLTTSTSEEGFLPGQLGAGKPILPEASEEHGLDKIVEAVCAFFKSNDIDPHTITYLGSMWVVILQDKVDLQSLPRKIGKLSTFYKIQVESFKGLEAAMRLTEPSDTIRDVSSYGHHLRPGVMLANKTYPPDYQEYLTSSGVAVRDVRTGDTFVTVASHGFPLGQERVFHPNNTGIPVGTIECSFRGTDISLMKLDPGYSYVNEPFAQELGTADVITGIQGINDIRIMDLVHMNSPFTGYMEGQIVGVSFERVPDSHPAGLGFWVKSNWIWLGNGLGPVDGCCGTPVIHEDKVVCFFRYIGVDNIARAVAAEMLSPRYELCGI